MLLFLLLAASPWTPLADGLHLAHFDSPARSAIGDSRITVLRIDPKGYALVIYSGAAQDTPGPRTAKQWAAEKGLVAAINPAMFHPDGRSTELMVSAGQILNGSLGKSHALLAFDPVDSSLPLVRQVDRQCDDLDALRPQYRSWIQSIRMVSCDGRNVWTPQPRRWSHAVIGTDTQGRLLFIHARSPFSTHDFITVLQGLPLHLDRLQYGEGGPEASLYVNTGKLELELFGSFETGFFESDLNDHAWPLPNILGVKKR